MAHVERMLWGVESLAALARRIDWRVVGLVLGAKLIVFLTIIYSYHASSFGTAFYAGNFHYPPGGAITLRNAFETWDAQHYLYLSRFGYSPGAESDRFQPLFPLLIHLATYVVRDAFVAGLLVSNLCSLVALYVLYLFSLKLLSSARAALAVVLMVLVFPTGFYLSLIYSESLFVLLSALFFSNLYRNDYRWCAVFGFLLPLTRPTGMLIAVPWIMHYLLLRRTLAAEPETLAAATTRRTVAAPSRSARPRRVRRPALFDSHAGPQKPILLLAPFAGAIIYLLFMYVSTGTAFSGIAGQGGEVANWYLSNLLRPDVLVADFFAPLSADHMHLLGFTDSLLDRSFFLFYLLGLPLVWIETDYVLFSFYLLLGLVPLLGSFMSYTRYLLPAFPLYLSVARAVDRARLYPAFALGAICSFALSLVLISTQALNLWVS